MGEEVNYESLLSVICPQNVYWTDLDDFFFSSLMVDMDFCGTDRPLDYCWLKPFSSTWLENLDFDVILRQVHFGLRVRVLLESHRVLVFIVGSSERI